MRKEIKHAYDQLHVSDDMTERLKQKLYHMDLNEEDTITEIFDVEEAPRFSFGKYLGFVAAGAVLGLFISVSTWGILEQHKNPLNPKSTVPTEYAYDAGSGETTEETTEETAILKED